MLHSFGIELIRFLHRFRSPFIDSFFKSLDLFDRNEFFFILIPLVWLLVGKKSGLKIFLAYLRGPVSPEKMQKVIEKMGPAMELTPTSL